MAWGARCTMVIVAVLASSGCIAAHSDSGNLRSAHNISGFVQRDQKRKETIDTSRGEEDDQEQKTPIDVDVRGRPSPILQDKGIVIATEKPTIVDDDQAVVSRHASTDVIINDINNELSAGKHLMMSVYFSFGYSMISLCGALTNSVIRPLTGRGADHLLHICHVSNNSKKSEDNQTCLERQKQGAEPWVYELVKGPTVLTGHVLERIYSILVDFLLPNLSESWNYCVTTLGSCFSGAFAIAKRVLDGFQNPGDDKSGFEYFSEIVGLLFGPILMNQYYKEQNHCVKAVAWFNYATLALSVIGFVLSFLISVWWELPKLLVSGIAVVLLSGATIVGVPVLFAVTCSGLLFFAAACFYVFPTMAEEKFANVDNIIWFCSHKGIAFSKISCPNFIFKTFWDTATGIKGACWPSAPAAEPDRLAEPDWLLSRLWGIWGAFWDWQNLFCMKSDVTDVLGTVLGTHSTHGIFTYLYGYVFLMQTIHLGMLVYFAGDLHWNLTPMKQFFALLQDVPQCILTVYLFQYKEHPDQYAYYSALTSTFSIITAVAIFLIESNNPPPSSGYKKASTSENQPHTNVQVEASTDNPG